MHISLLNALMCTYMHMPLCMSVCLCVSGAGGGRRMSCRRKKKEEAKPGMLSTGETPGTET